MQSAATAANGDGDGDRLLLFCFIFAVMGVQLFAEIQVNGVGEGFTTQVNFQYFLRSFVTLLRFATGENWNGFMHEVASAGEEGVCRDTNEMDYRNSPQRDGISNMCGYEDRQGCVPLDGCGSDLIFTYDPSPVPSPASKQRDT